MADMSDPIILSAIGAVATAGGAAITKLWQQIQSHYAATTAALLKCEAEHGKNHERIGSMFSTIAELSGKVGKLEGRLEGVQAAETRRQEQDDSKTA